MSATDVPPAGHDELREALTAIAAVFSVPPSQIGPRALEPLPCFCRPAVRAAHTHGIGCPWRDRADALSAPSAPPGTPGHVPTDARGVTGRSRQGIGNDDGGDES